ncbi:carbohydrate esterase family 16 protein [Phycomyces blakesleeanus]|uniref:Carbohydrate esterase family 16 protein n=2 Tax=Phycomyces blakesleeanus TaxID=4837 RepID=A0A162TPA1_PHYB8|nr:carbohydrate esterase family 16 protein [Phycomyces blakesleeanus NRRL 1555(-)]OAD69992.1 carbohydrate esterase family 16 protein [Phycomyces blakesleeanus NRRL 1555(-)]|eukprot:XP_018288032.1 carbohydrate esterase family 16 protein [Phycomyces blakesleeanus NRRL 1555(-)]
MSKPDYLFVYGDSYSDLSERTRKSNGPLWSEQLSDAWGTKLRSYAESAALTCPTPGSSSDLSKQFKAAKALATANKNSLHAIFFGITDVAGAQDKTVKSLLNCVKDQVAELEALDPTSRILLFGLPPLEYSPYYSNSTHKSKVKQRVSEFNVGLEDAVNDWTSETQLNIAFVDNSGLFSYVLGDPEGYNVENVEEAYWETCQGRCSDPIDSYLWWDQLHMTGAGHRAMAENIISSNPFSLPTTPKSTPPAAPIAPPPITPSPPKSAPKDSTSNNIPSTHNSNLDDYVSSPHSYPDTTNDSADFNVDGSVDHSAYYPWLFIVLFILMLVLVFRRNRIINTFSSYWKARRSNAPATKTTEYSPV